MTSQALKTLDAAQAENTAFQNELLPFVKAASAQFMAGVKAMGDLEFYDFVVNLHVPVPDELMERYGLNKRLEVVLRVSDDGTSETKEGKSRVKYLYDRMYLIDARTTRSNDLTQLEILQQACVQDTHVPSLNRLKRSE